MEETGAVQQINQQAQEQDDYPHQCHHHQVCNQKEESEESALVQLQSRKPNLSSLQIPERSMESTLSSFMRIDTPSHGPSPSSTRARLPPKPNSAKLKPSVRNLLPKGSFRAKYLSQCGEETVLDTPDAPMSNKPSTSMSFPLKAQKSAHSLPVSPVANLGLQSAEERDLEGHFEISKLEIQHHMMRSSSVPVIVKTRSLRRMNSDGGLIRVIPATPHPATVDGASPKNASDTEIASEDAGEDIPEEEAVCRICLVELREGGETLKMQCSCRGELALAHQECAVKWFTIKGNKTCDVCKQDVKNLPVILLKTQYPQTLRRRPPAAPQQREVTHCRPQDVPILVMVSMLAYFCFMEQLLVSDVGPRALAICLVFSCVLGLLSSMITSIMVSKSYIWAYASFQFVIVILFAHVFYNLLNVNSILTVLLSSFTGFGIAITTNALIVEFLRWRVRQNPLQHISGVTQQHHHRSLHQYRQRHQPQQQQQSVENLPVEPTDGAELLEVRIQTT
ncbi:uncharacterized protein LOC131311858 isoform X1 [Rhododendron vialii]|uniref:uncharacterized protein LOC131311858 isoform X1 n=1 Tax=Rhododendron vialii TaxID=182163 RepID=UPI00265E3FB8|nr:uncharacterized protein LOC131311858 isoform X1 [Rhododendron vialii]